MQFAKALRREAHEAGMEPVEIAALLKVSERTVSRWFNGDVSPQLRYYKKLIALFPDLPETERV